MENNLHFEKETTFETETVGDGVYDVPNASLSEGADDTDPTYVDINREEFIAFRMLTARVMGPLRLRVPTLLIAVVCCLLLGGYALFEWLGGAVSYPDPVLLAGAALTLIPAVIVWGYIPWRLRRDAGKQYDRSVQAGVDFCGRLTVSTEFVEKAGGSLTAHIRLGERCLFIETPELMVLATPGIPAIVLPARCLTNEVTRQVRQAAERLPVRNRRYLGRIQPRGEAVIPPPPKAKPEEKWVSTFTYTAEEYATVLRGIIQQHFWRMAPLLALVAVMGALTFGYNGESLMPCVGYFVAFMVVLVLFNLVLPLRRVKAQCAALSPHDRTIQVRMDTMCVRAKLPKGGETLVLWCDVEHVYEREDFVEIVHNKQSALFIPKRVIDDLDALDTVITQCRGEQ